MDNQSQQIFKRPSDFIIQPSNIKSNHSFDEFSIKKAEEYSDAKYECSKVIKIILILLILSLLAMQASHQILSDSFKYFQPKQLQKKQRKLQEYSSIQNSDLPIIIKSNDDIPRWFHLNKEQGTQLQYTQLKGHSKQQSLMIPKQTRIRQFDAAWVIFQNNNNLNFQIVAGITGQKLKLGSKLLELNTIKNQYQKYIYDFERQYYDRRYEINSYEELPMCIIVPTYNNAQNQRYRYNLESIARQQYKNYKAVIVDDNSQDSNAFLIEELIAKMQLNTRQFVFIRNPTQMRAMKSIRTAALTYCQPEDIMIIVDGDDMLVGRQVFKLFNAIFQRDKAWFVYSNFIDSVTNSVGYSRPFPANTIVTSNYRHQQFYTSHLRAFYTSLFLKIEDKDLKNNAGDYFQAANDVAICIPILEMSGQRVSYIPEITYAYNSNTGNNNHLLRLVQQQENSRTIRSRPSYEKLQKL